MLPLKTLLFSLLLSPAALAFPDHDPSRETTLTDTSGASTLGTWTQSANGVALTAPHSHGRLQYWIPNDPTSKTIQ